MIDGYSLILTGFLVLAQIFPGLQGQRPSIAASNDQKMAYFRNICAQFMTQKVLKDPTLKTAMDGVIEEVLKGIEGNSKATHDDGSKKFSPDSRISLLGNITFGEAVDVFRLLCQGKDNPQLVNRIDWQKPFDEYMALLKDIPDYNRILNQVWSQSTEVLDKSGKKVGDIFAPESNRLWVAPSSIPDIVKKAFVASEDGSFFDRQDKGVDLNGILRAIQSVATKGKLIGGSTITQQLVKNTLLNSGQNLRRKYQEMLLSVQIESDPRFNKEMILAHYLNIINFGRQSFGIRKAAENYFGKRLEELNISEIAFLAGVIRGPEPDPKAFYRLGIRRRNSVLDLMAKKKYITDAEALKTKREILVFNKRTGNRYFIDYVAKQVRDLIPVSDLNSGGVTIATSLDLKMQKDTELALAEGLFDYEFRLARTAYRGPVTNLYNRIKEIRYEFDLITQSEAREAEEDAELDDSSTPAPTKTPSKPVSALDENLIWRNALSEVPIPIPDIYWDLAIILNNEGRQTKIGFVDGQIINLSVPKFLNLQEPLQNGDVVWVHRQGDVAYLRDIPTVQGAVVALNTKTGQILSYTGGLSHHLSQYDRANPPLARRQPGSLMKPFTYLAALQQGIQPNKVFRDVFGGAVFAPIERGSHTWTPHNYNNDYANYITMRQGLEESRNVVTAEILQSLESPVGGEIGLDYVMRITKDFGFYPEYAKGDRYYPFILGSKPARLIEVVTAYARIGNLGYKVKPHAVDSINGWSNRPIGAVAVDQSNDCEISSADLISRYQLRHLLRGVIERGTATRLKPHAPYLAGKTGTTDDNNDVWFVGTSPTITMGVWVGYNNGDGSPRRALVSEATGGSTALPIFQNIFEKYIQANGKPAPFGAVPGVNFQWIDRKSGKVTNGGDGSVYEALRNDDRYRLNSESQSRCQKDFKGVY